MCVRVLRNQIDHDLHESCTDQILLICVKEREYCAEQILLICVEESCVDRSQFY